MYVFVAFIFIYFLFLQIDILIPVGIFSGFSKLGLFLFVVLVTTISTITFYLSMLYLTSGMQSFSKDFQVSSYSRSFFKVDHLHFYHTYKISHIYFS